MLLHSIQYFKYKIPLVLVSDNTYHCFVQLSLEFYNLCSNTFAHGIISISERELLILNI